MSEFKIKVTWNPNGNIMEFKSKVILELLLSQTEKDLLSIRPRKACVRRSTLQGVFCKMAEVSLLNQQTRGPQW